MAPKEQIKQERAARAALFRERLVEHQRRVPPGWQKEIAHAVGIDEPAMSKIVTGAKAATVEQMAKIAAHLKAPQLVPAVLRPLTRDFVDIGHRPPQGVSDPAGNVAATPIPASLRSFIDDRPTLHPAVKWELEQNHDQRTPEYVIKDDRFWDRLAHAWADILGIAGGPYQERGADRGEAPRPRKG